MISDIKSRIDGYLVRVKTGKLKFNRSIKRERERRETAQLLGIAV